MKSSCITLFKALIVAVPFLFFTACEKTDKYIDWKEMNTAWYEQHKNDEGFKVTESGLSYKRISPEANPSEGRPNKGDVVTVDYKLSYIDGTEVQAKDNIPFYLASKDMIKGFSEALLKMTVGETFKFYMPHTIGYGAQKGGLIPPYSTLIYEIRLIKTEAY